MAKDYRDDLVGTYCGGYGNPKAKLFICGEAPGPDEVSFKPEPRPFVGTTGRMVGEATGEAGCRIDDAYRTNVFKYYPPDSNIKRWKETGHTFEECLPQLYAEIESVNPNCILAIGETALKALTGKEGIGTWRGSILSTKDKKYKVIPTIHPAALFRTKGDGKGAIPWRTWYIIKNDIWKAVQDSEFRELRIPERTRLICRSSVELERFLDKHLSLSVFDIETNGIDALITGKVKRDTHGRILCSVDIESHHNIPILIGLGFNKNEAMSVPLFNVGSWARSGALLSRSELIRIWNILRRRIFEDPNVVFVGQNFKYDHEKIQNTLGFYIGPGRLHADVGLMSHIIQPEFRIALDFMASIDTREPYWKAEGKEFDITRMPLEQLMQYNCTDVLVTYELYEKYVKDLEEIGSTSIYFDFRNQLHDFYMGVERVGFRVDETARLRLIDKYVDLYNQLNQEIKDVCGYYINPNSIKDVPWLLFEVLKLPARENTTDDTLSLLYANHAKTQPQKVGIANILKSRRARKTISTYLTAVPDFDRRMRTTFRIAGTETDRSATHLLESPVRPEGIIESRVGGKKTRKKKKLGLVLHNLTKHGEIGGDVREMFVPDSENEVFGSVDMSQAQARIVAVLSDDWDLVKLFDTVDIHRLTGSWCFGIPYEKIGKKSAERQIAKPIRHAGNFDLRGRRLVEMLAQASLREDKDYNMSEWKAKQVLETFHGFSPKVRGIFHAEIQRCLQNNGRTLVDAFGRRRTFHERWGDELFREAYAHLPQVIESGHMKRAALLVKIRLPWLRILNEAHDSLDWTCTREQFNEVANVMKEEIEKPIDFSQCSLSRGSLVIPVEIKIAEKNYGTGSEKNPGGFVDYKIAS